MLISPNVGTFGHIFHINLQPHWIIVMNILTLYSDYRSGFRFMIGFTGHLNSLTTINYSVVSVLCRWVQKCSDKCERWVHCERRRLRCVDAKCGFQPTSFIGMLPDVSVAVLMWFMALVSFFYCDYYRFSSSAVKVVLSNSTKVFVLWYICLLRRFAAILTCSLQLRHYIALYSNYA
jgi:hypothetical protein